MSKKKKTRNEAAIRDVLVYVYNTLEKLQLYHINDITVRRAFRSRLCYAKSVIAAALAKPPRNCDVGTAEEQMERFRKFCKMDYISGDCPDDCPLYRKDYSTIHCPFAWAQMPYEEG
jgi:hypothetical protein